MPPWWERAAEELQRGQIIAAPRGPGAALRAASGGLYNPGLFAVGSGGEAAAPPVTGICIWFLAPYVAHYNLEPGQSR